MSQHSETDYKPIDAIEIHRERGSERGSYSYIVRVFTMTGEFIDTPFTGRNALAKACRTADILAVKYSIDWTTEFPNED